MTALENGVNTLSVILWSADKGALFRYSSGAMKVGHYRSTVTFTLEDAPPLNIEVKGNFNIIRKSKPFYNVKALVRSNRSFNIETAP